MSDTGDNKSWVKSIIKILLPILILLGAFGIARHLVQTRPKASRQAPPKSGTLVEWISAVKTNRAVRIEAAGTVRAAREVELRTEVQGRVIELAEGLVEGARFKEGDVLLQLEKTDYEAAVASAMAALEQARLNLVLEEQRSMVAKAEWEQSESGPTDERVRDVVWRVPHLAAAKAAVASAEAHLAQAHRQLERTSIRAPFDGVILRKHIELGAVLSPQSRVIDFAGTDQFFIDCTFPLRDVAWLNAVDPDGEGAAGMVYVSVPVTGASYTGRLHKIRTDLSGAGLMVQGIVAVDNPLAQPDQPLLIGTFVRCELLGENMSDVWVLPREVMHSGDDLWLIDESNQLEIRRPDVLWLERDIVVLKRGVDADDRVIISALPNVIPGMDLIPIGDGAQRGTPDEISK